MQKVGAYCRYHTSLESKLSELAIIVVARAWNQTIEWHAHQPLALNAGLNPEIANSIENRELPKFDEEREEVVYQVAHEITETRVLSETTYDHALNILGEKTLFELTAIIGYCSFPSFERLFSRITPVVVSSQPPRTLAIMS